jgi:uncharacterized membrane protein YbhN (UPF0104 family)
LTDEPSEHAPQGPRQRSLRSRIRLIVSIAGPLVVIAVLAYLIASHGEEISRALKRTSAGEIVLVTALALLTLIARTEAVVACLNAMGSRPTRVDIHASNSLTFLAALINHYVSSIVRAALMQRIDRERSPTILQMVMVDTSTTLIEALIVAILVVVSASVLGLDWWVPVLIVLAGIAGVLIAYEVRRRYSHISLFRGLDVLAHSRQRVVVTGLMLIVIVAQVARTFVVLQSVGLKPSLLQAVATFVAAGVLSSLFAGPGAGTAAGPLLVFGSDHVAAATAAGLELSVTTLVAGIIYAIVGGPVFLSRWRSVTA